MYIKGNSIEREKCDNCNHYNALRDKEDKGYCPLELSLVHKDGLCIHHSRSLESGISR